MFTVYTTSPKLLTCDLAATLIRGLAGGPLLDPDRQNLPVGHLDHHVDDRGAPEIRLLAVEVL